MSKEGWLAKRMQSPTFRKIYERIEREEVMSKDGRRLCPQCGSAVSAHSVTYLDGTRTRRCREGHLFAGEPVAGSAAAAREVVQVSESKGRKS